MNYNRNLQEEEEKEEKEEEIKKERVRERSICCYRIKFYYSESKQ